MCPYSFYKNLNGRDYIYCLNTDGVCPFTRYCTIIGKMIPNDRKYYTMEDCNLKNEKVLENGEYKVRFEKKGFLQKENRSYQISNRQALLELAHVIEPDLFF